MNKLTFVIAFVGHHVLSAACGCTPVADASDHRGKTPARSEDTSWLGLEKFLRRVNFDCDLDPGVELNQPTHLLPALGSLSSKPSVPLSEPQCGSYSV